MTRDERITAAQLRLRQRMPKMAPCVDEGDWRAAARWWDLEALRGGPGAGGARTYAANMRWAVELAREYGPGAWLELIARAGVGNPTR